MIYSLLIQSSPAQTSGSSSALKFAQALLGSGHRIYRVFLYGESVNLANSQIVPPQEEQNLSKDWVKFIKSNNIDCVVCIAAALKRGVLNKEESQRYDKSAPVMDNSFELSGLGQLIDATAHSDKVITFS